MNLQANAEWMADLHEADAILISRHARVSTHMLGRRIRDGNIVTVKEEAGERCGACAIWDTSGLIEVIEL